MHQERSEEELAAEAKKIYDSIDPKRKEKIISLQLKMATTFNTWNLCNIGNPKSELIQGLKEEFMEAREAFANATSEWEVFTHYIYPTPEGLSEHDHDLHPEAEDIHLQVQDAYDSMEPQERDAIKHHEAAFWESFRLWNEHNTTMFKDRTPERLQHDADLRQEFERRRRIFDMTTRKWRAFRYYIW
jgi:hypothetical protein